MKGLAVFMTALALVGAGVAPTWAKGPSDHPAMVRTPETAQAPTVNQVLARSWLGEGAPLREQLVWNSLRSTRDDSFDTFEAERATIRACQTERYDASRSNLLDGGMRPLKDC